jgi:hypothetical protein
MPLTTLEFARTVTLTGGHLRSDLMRRPLPARALSGLILLTFSALLAPSCADSTAPDSDTCLQGQTTCDGACVDTYANPEHCGECGNACEEGLVCEAASCVLSCPPDTTECSGECVNPQMNNDHCGGCGLSCAPGYTCQGGSCQ